MAEFIVRNLEEEVKVVLKRRVARPGCSMEEEAWRILRNALKEGPLPVPRLGSRIAARFNKAGLTEDLPEFSGQVVTPADFGA